MNSPSLNHGFPLFFFFLFLHGLRLILVLVAFVAEIAQGGMASHEETAVFVPAQWFQVCAGGRRHSGECAHFDWRGSRT